MYYTDLEFDFASSLPGTHKHKVSHEVSDHQVLEMVNRCSGSILSNEILSPIVSMPNNTYLNMESYLK